MSITIKQKLLNAISAHPKLVTLGIGLALTLAIGTAIGMVDHSHMAFAARQTMDQDNHA
jgi:ABC-type nickel/cobalt efflux system permease component RcnA